MSSLWLENTNNSFLSFNDTTNNTLESDVCIIGAGIFGVSCAYYLSKLGYKVTILDKDVPGHKTTGHTTAKITSQHALFYDYLVNSFGTGFAKDYLYSNEQAIENIKNIIDLEKIKCDFKFQNNYVYTTDSKFVKKIKKEVLSVSNLGYNCEFVTKTGLPFDIKGAICFKNQAQFNPIKYLLGLCDKCISSGNATFFNNSPVFDVENFDDYYISYSTNFNVKSKYVIIATHYPFINFPGFYFAKMYQSTSYIIAVDTKKTLFNGMYISADQPIFSFRTARYNNKDLLLVAGADHKTGQPSSYNDTYGLLENEVKKYYPDSDILYRWSTQDCISLDKLPYIGSYCANSPNMFLGTGFKKWGMTLSNVAANIVTDSIIGKTNKFSYLFTPSRLKPLKNADEFKNMLVQSTNSLIFNKFKHANMNFDEIANNSGGIVEINNTKVGIYKDPNGNIYAVKPICTHLGCLLSWNDIDKTWDCPCHGSRFNFDGKNLYNPAVKNLDIYTLK